MTVWSILRPLAEPESHALGIDRDGNLSLRHITEIPPGARITWRADGSALIGHEDTPARPVRTWSRAEAEMRRKTRAEP